MSEVVRALRRWRGSLEGLAPGHTARTEANARLTAAAGLALFVLLAAQGVTILSVRSLLTAHVAIGFVLLGPLIVKLGSTGWRFLRYYTGDTEYGAAGPPKPLLRLLAPFLVLTTIVVFGSGIALLATTPERDSALLLVHKASFVLWFGATTVHVLAYLLAALRWGLVDLAGKGPAAVVSSRRARQAVLGISVLAGIALAVVGVAWAHPWLSAPDVRAGRGR